MFMPGCLGEGFGIAVGSAELYWLILLALTPLIVHSAVNLLGRTSPRLETSPLYVLVRVFRLHSLLVEAAEEHPLLTRVLSHILLALYPGLLLSFFWLFGNNLVRLVSAPSQAVSVTPVLPGINISMGEAPYFLAALLVAVIVHESAHGLVGAGERMPIKSVGGLLFLMLPAVFVEFDEEGFTKAGREAKVRMAAAGPSANMALAAIIILLFFTGPPIGIIVTGTENPAALHLQMGDVITAINQTRIISTESFSRYMAAVKPGDVLEVHTMRGVFAVKTGVNPRNESKGFLGVAASGFSSALAYLGAPLHPILIRFLNWLNIISLSLAILNVAPIDPLDGGRMLNAVLAGRGHWAVKPLKLAVTSMAIVILLGNFALSYLRFGP